MENTHSYEPVSYTDKDGDVFTAAVDPDIPTLLDIRINGCDALLIRTDAAEAIAALILKAAKPVPRVLNREEVSDFAKRWDARVVGNLSENPS